MSAASSRDAELVNDLVAYAIEHEGDDDLGALDQITWGHPDFGADPGDPIPRVLHSVVGAVYQWMNGSNPDPHVDLINVVTGRHGAVERITLQGLVDEGALEPIAGSASIFRVVGLAQRRRGRPSMGKPLMVRLPDGMRAEVDRIAAERGVPAAEVIRDLIARGLAD